MPPRPLALTALLLAAASAAALWRAASTAGAPVRPVAPHAEVDPALHFDAARAAAGRRVLVLFADPGKPRSARLLESGRAPEGWALFDGAPAAAAGFDAVLAEAAAAAGAAWDPAREFPEEVARALDVLAVKVVAVDDNQKGAARVTVRPLADPVLRVADASATAARPADVRATPARESDGWTFRDWEDDLWGGAVTVDTKSPATFVFPYPAAGAHVLVNGQDVTPRPLAGLVALGLPAGTSRVEVRFVERGAGAVFAIAGAAGLLIAVICGWLAVRPSADEVRAAAEGAAA